MRIQSDKNTLKTQLNEGVKTDSVESEKSLGQKLGSDYLYQQFTALLDKIAADLATITEEHNKEISAVRTAESKETYKKVDTEDARLEEGIEAEKSETINQADAGSAKAVLDKPNSEPEKAAEVQKSTTDSDVLNVNSDKYPEEKTNPVIVKTEVKEQELAPASEEVTSELPKVFEALNQVQTKGSEAAKTDTEEESNLKTAQSHKLESGTSSKNSAEAEIGKSAASSVKSIKVAEGKSVEIDEAILKVLEPAQIKANLVVSSVERATDRAMSALMNAVILERSGLINAQASERVIEAGNSKGKFDNVGIKTSGGTNVVDAGLLKNSDAGSAADTGAPRLLTRAASLRTLDKVQEALKEVAKSKDGKTLSFRLDPPELGSMKVDVSLRDGALHARLVAEVPAVAQMLKERAHELQSMLRRLGLEVDRVTVSVMTDSQSQSNFERQMNQGQTMAERHAASSHGVQNGQPELAGKISVGDGKGSGMSDHWIA